VKLRCGTGSQLPEVAGYRYELAVYAIMSGRTRRQLTTGRPVQRTCLYCRARVHLDAASVLWVDVWVDSATYRETGLGASCYFSPDRHHLPDPAAVDGCAS
jgi:hypothetical protein